MDFRLDGYYEETWCYGITGITSGALFWFHGYLLVCVTHLLAGFMTCVPTTCLDSFRVEAAVDNEAKQKEKKKKKFVVLPASGISEKLGRSVRFLFFVFFKLFLKAPKSTKLGCFFPNFLNIQNKTNKQTNIQKRNKLTKKKSEFRCSVDHISALCTFPPFAGRASIWQHYEWKRYVINW